MLKSSSRLVAGLLVLLVSPVARAQIEDPGTGSFGAFSPKAFVEASPHWSVFRAVGPHSKSGFPCDSMANSCTREKEYIFQRVRTQNRTTSINVGVGETMGMVKRHHAGTQRTIEVQSPNNITLARVDDTRVSSRLGFDAALTATVSRTLGMYGGTQTLGHVEAKDAAWSTVEPFSFYYHPRDDPGGVFGLTVVEKLTPLNMIQNYLRNTPGTDRIREGTYWCLSDAWRLSDGAIEGVFKNDEFDMAQCRGTPLLSSDTQWTFGEAMAAAFLNRQDSRVTLYSGGERSYEVKSETEWLCPFDCDGSVYTMHFAGEERPTIRIGTDRWNILSSTGFKVKTVQVDWDGDGLQPLGGNLKDLVSTADRDLVAVIVSEVGDSQLTGQHNGRWTQHTYIMFPPGAAGGTIDPAYQAQIERAIGQLDGPVPDRAVENMWNAKVLDAILAAMPDQTQSSPELADAEEKLDELRLFMGMELFGARAIGSDLMFDVWSEVDATTAVSWQPPGRSRAREGKVEWLYDMLN